MPPVPSTIAARIAERVLVLDGATGTELERAGAGSALPLWSAGALLEAQEAVLRIHRDYANAGADILVANTFRTNPRTLRSVDCTRNGPELNRLAIDLARRAATGREILVAASIAPVEDCYHPEFVPAPTSLRAEHAQMMGWLTAAKPDLIWIETMNTVREVRIAAGCAAERQLPFVVSMVVAENGNLLSGESIEDVVEAIEPLQPLAVGLNCIPPRGLSAILPRLRSATSLPLVAYGHIGNRTPIRGWSYGQEISPAEYAEFAAEWIGMGVRIVGGCCGTTPAHIAAVRQKVDQLSGRSSASA